MKKAIFLFWLLLPFFTFPDSCIDQWAKEIIPAEIGLDAVIFANLVSRRYYFIQRLEPIMELLQRNEATLIDNDEFGTINLNNPKSPRIKQAIHSMAENLQLAPLFMVWDEFKSFKSIEDQSLIEDFTKEILIISLSLASKSSDIHTIAREISKASSKQIKTLLTKCHDNLEKFKAKKSILGDLDLFASINVISYRYYIVNRLEFAMNLIAEIDRQYPSICKNSTIIDLNLDFCTPCITNCKVLANNQHSLKPLIKLCKDAKHFKFIKEEKFNRDFTLMLFSFYISLLKKHYKKFDPSLKRNTIQALFQIYSQIEALPLEEILDAIDMISEELPPILEKYNVKTGMNWQEWKEWLKQYWWIPPGLACVYGFRVAYLFKYHERPNKRRRSSLWSPPRQSGSESDSSSNAAAHAPIPPYQSGRRHTVANIDVDLTRNARMLEVARSQRRRSSRIVRFTTSSDDE